VKALDRLKEFGRPWYLRCVYFPLFPQRCPPNFRECWSHPFTRLTAAPPPNPQPGSGSGVLFFPMNDWHSRRQRTQQLASAFAARGTPVVCLNPHLGRQYDTLPLFDRAPRLAEVAERIYELHVRLPREPVFHQRNLDHAESAQVCAAAECAAQRLGLRSAVQILSFPIWFEAARGLRERAGFPIVYDCHDLLSGFGNIAPEITELEREALCGSDLVLFSSERLMEYHCARQPGLRPKSRLLRNAVDARLPLGQPDRQKPVAVYAGALERWFDVAALREAALENPGCRFELIGRVDAPAVSALGSLANVELLGELPYPEAAARLAAGTVGLIPFLVNELTLATNPIKIYEYFACGLPVVSAPLPEVQSFGDLVYTASTPAEFAGAVKRALAEDSPERQLRRRKIAESETWPARVSELAALCQALGKGATAPPEIGRGGAESADGARRPEDSTTRTCASSG
jgi:glycosyltransferase involved in cell wall biosynthesis